MRLQVKNFKIPPLSIRQKKPSLQAYFSVLIADKDSIIEIHRVELHSWELIKKPEPWLQLPSMTFPDREDKDKIISMPFVEIDIQTKAQILKEIYQQFNLATQRANNMIEDAKQKQNQQKQETKKQNIEGVSNQLVQAFDLEDPFEEETKTEELEPLTQLNL